jgi:SAM-dependent methyltransferase
MKIDPALVSELQSLARQYPADLVGAQLQDVLRVAFHISLVTSRKGPNCSLCDLGGGIGLFSLGCAALGMKVTLVDDFHDAVNERFGPSVLDLHRFHGVTVLSRDVVREGIELPEQSLDVVTTFDSMEHWHHSPKRLFAAVVECLVPGGLFVLGVPNCVNLRKRIMVPLGFGAWSLIKDWYEPPVFRGHVREPSVADLRYIAQDMNLTNVSILGRNWLGYVSRYRTARAITPLVDGFLSYFPSLCADIYLLGTKP